MSIDALSPRGISPFGLAGHVSPSEQLITLTYGQLQDLICEAIERATAPLEARIQDLEDEVRGGEDRVGSLPGGQGMKISTFQIVQDLQAENSALKRELEALQELRPWLEAISKKINRLESRPEKESPKAEEHIEELYQIMRKNMLPSLSFANAAKFLGIGKGRVKQLKPQIAKDGRFDIIHSAGHKQKLIIALRRHGAKTG